MKALVASMQKQEQRHLWSMRWLIASAYVQAGGVLYIGMGEAGRAHVPTWAIYAWVVLALGVAGLAAVAKAVQPKDGLLQLPLGAAVAPAPVLGRHTPRPPGAAVLMPEDAPPSPPEAED